jgi:hypothetical protein
MLLQLDPFAVGEDLMVKMRRLQIHGLLFYCTPASLESAPCKLEMETAHRIGAATMVIADGASPPAHLKNRLYPRLPGLSAFERIKAIDELAIEMKPRAKSHVLLDWLHEPGRTVEEREAGCNWLSEQQGQILAEFMVPIALLHRGKDEDNIVCRILAGVLAGTKLPEACSYLKEWLTISNHPNAIFGIQKALGRLRCE